MAAHLRKGLVRLADDPRLGRSQARIRALTASGNAYRSVSVASLSSRVLFAPARLVSFELQMRFNAKAW
jgi:hypothetical protein